MKKTLLILTLIAVLVISLASCGEDKVLNGDEALAAAPELLTEALDLYEILYGSGIPYNAMGEKTGKYYPADEGYLDASKFKNISELKSYISTVFSDGYSAVIVASTLTGGVAEDGAYYARYIDSEGEIYGEAKGTGTLLVYSEYTPMLEGRREYDMSTLEIVEATAEKVTLSVMIRVFLDGGDEVSVMEDVIDVDFVLEDDGWRIDSPAY